MMGGVMKSQRDAAGAIYSPPSLPFASFPAAASVPGQYRIASDLNNASLRSDGTYWNPANGHAVIANSYNTNLTTQSITPAMITSVSFPGGFARAGSRFMVWVRASMPAISAASREVQIRAGASGAGLANFRFGRCFTNTNSSVVTLRINCELTALVASGTQRGTADLGLITGLYSGATSNDLAPSVNFTAPWEIGFSGISCAETDHTAVTATWAAGVATFTFTAHGYAVGDKIVTTTFTPSGYNGTLVVASVPTADSWTAAIASDPGGAGTGGTTSRTSNVTLVDYYVEWLQ